MAGWPTNDRADDQRLAQALQAGDPTAMAGIYDAYAPRLYDYCHVLLRDQELAAQGLHDSLIIVQERISALSYPGLFRGWLYAVTRAECLRRRAETGIPEDRRKAREAEGPVETDESTRRLVHAALMVLSSAQRELLDLALRHELDTDELAGVLSATPQEVVTLVEQARNDLDDAFAAVVVAATGRDDCPSVPGLAGPAGRPLDAETCGRLARHIGSCPICGLRANRKVATARLLHTMPIAAVPADLRARVLGTVTPEYADLRATIAARFDEPRSAPRHEPDEDRPSRRAGMWVALGAVACGVLIFGGILLVLTGSGGDANSGDQAAAAPPSGSPSDDPSASSPVGPSPSRSDKSPTPTPTPTPKKSRTPKPLRTAGHPERTTPVPTTSSARPPASGTLAVAGCDMRYTGHCEVKVTAEGGPVHWAVAGTQGGISASGAGDLDAGQSAYVPVARDYKDFCVFEDKGAVKFASGSSADVHWNC
ncbi:sigma-70 family RNA polymerase sigma factor [Actinoallomurus sp. NPDC052274]|uniref:RNA polymerase sigma factor n=1 Tax=Actinoallomurus sp. NPDC052274 TaxID=3155420 RepID=UPI00343F7985